MESIDVMNRIVGQLRCENIYSWLFANLIDGCRVVTYSFSF